MQYSIGSVSSEPRRVAEAAFTDGNSYGRLGDELSPLFTDAQFAPFYPKRGQPALLPWRLARLTMLQFASGLSDRQAAAAVRSRIDWKNLLHLDLTDEGFDYSVLSEFRTRLVFGEHAKLTVTRCVLASGSRYRTSNVVQHTLHA